MREALALAQRGRGLVEPNPRVGAVALRGGAVVGRGYHGYYGGPHAEVMALRDAAATGAIPDALVVTLEPCSSAAGFGGKKTPPCTDAILAAGVPRVVFGASDPDPRHTGRAKAALEAEGVAVHSGVLADECTRINQPFHRWLSMAVPWVIAKWAMTLDGKTASRSGDSRWISGEASRRRVHEVRAQVDAVLVGYRTAVLDDPELTVRHVAGDNPIRVVVDPLAALPLSSKLVQTAVQTPTWVLVGPDADTAAVDQLAARGVSVLPCAGGGRQIDVVDGLTRLRAAGIRRVLMEGGGRLTADLLARGCVHQVMAFVAPKVIGGADASTPVGGVGLAEMIGAWQFGEVFTEMIEDDIVVHAFAT